MIPANSTIIRARSGAYASSAWRFELMIMVNVISITSRCFVCFEKKSGSVLITTKMHKIGTQALKHQPINTKIAVNRINQSD